MLEDPKIEQVLHEIDHHARLVGIDVFAVGGFARNKVLKEKHPIDSDIDLMADGWGGLKLAGFLSSSLHAPLRYYHRTRTALVEYNGIELEFQSFMPNYAILEEFRKIEVPQSILYLNVFSRDFTINTILYSIRSKKIYDLTNQGLSDIENKLIRTPINPEVLVKSNPIIILRAIMFANRMGFYIDEHLQVVMRKYKNMIMKQISEERFEVAIRKILKPNPRRGLKMLYQYRIDEISPFDLKEFFEKEII